MSTLRGFLLAGLIAAAWTLPGCRGALPAYSVHAKWEQKDVIAVKAFLPEALDPEGYVKIAELELETLRGSRPRSEVPIYEVRVEFFRMAGDLTHPRRLAQVSLFPSSLSRPADIVLY